MVARALAILLLLVFTTRLCAQSKDEVNAANNPLQPTLGVNLQNQYSDQLYDLDGDSNASLLRGSLPHKLFGKPQL